jgi:carboxymethylenebutenolidase
MCHEDCPHPITGGAALTETNTVVDLADGATLPVFHVSPEGEAKGGLVLIHDIYGPGPFYQDTARRLANEGYVVALPDLFHRLPPADSDSRDDLRARGAQLVQRTALSDLQSLLIWVKHLENTHEKVGTIGFCMGGTLVLLLASREPRPVASVCYYGFPIRERTPLQPIVAYDDAEVATLESPILGFFGDQDHGVGPENVNLYSDKLITYAKPHDFITYTGVGHAFITFDPEAPSYNEAKDAWERTLKFFAQEFAR